MKVRFKGFGYFVADKVVTNDDLSTVMDTSDEWISQRTGIKERRYSSYNTAYLAINAAKKAIIDSNVNPNDIDLVICATITPDNFTPSLSASILDALGIKKAMAFDINAACSGFIYALNTAASLLEANGYKNALIIGAEVLSKLIDYTDRSTAILFGDGAGAVVIDNNGDEATFICHAKTDIDNVLYAKGISINNNLYENSTCNDYYLKMDGKEVYKFAVSSCEEIIKEILDKNNMTIDDINMVIPHQANQRIIASFSKKLNIPNEKIYMNLEHYGNTSAASVALALAEAKEKNIIKKGDNLLLVGFGAGLTWAATIIKY